MTKDLRGLILERHVGFTTAGVWKNIDTKRVEPQEVWELTRVTVENRSTTNTVDILIGIQDGLVFYAFNKFSGVATEDLATVDKPYYLREGTNLRVKHKGAGTGDEIRVHLNGVRIKLEEANSEK